LQRSAGLRSGTSSKPAGPEAGAPPISASDAARAPVKKISRLHSAPRSATDKKQLDRLRAAITKPLHEKNMTIRLFIKPTCPWCRKAMAWLDERGVKYEKLDVIANSAVYTEMVNLSEQRYVPVIDVDGKILADFGPEELAEFWKQFEGADGKK
jgi:glutaredoxin 3